MEEFDQAGEDHLLEESERRRFVYSDLEAVIESGYLEHTVFYRGVPIIFRTLDRVRNSNLISRISGTKGPEWKVWYVASHIYSVGHFVVEGGNSAWYLWSVWLKELTLSELNPMVSIIRGLRNRIDRCYGIIEAYCFEPYSRSAWRVQKSGGIPENLHLLQKVWYSINTAEDLIEEDARLWSHTRAIVGSMSSKGAKSLQESEKKFLEKRKSKSHQIIEQTINRILFGEVKKEPEYIEINGQKVLMPAVQSSQTVEEMEEEMARIMRGEEDFHDMVVRQYKERAKARVEEAKRAREEAREEALGGQEHSGPSKIVGYTEEQLRGLGVKSRRATSVGPIPESDQAFLEYLDKPVKIGWIGLSGIPEEANKGKKEDGGSLQEKMTSRKTVMK